MAQPEQEDSFIPEGHAPFPSLSQDNGRTGEFTDWTDQALNDRIAQYIQFIAESRLPHQQSIARRIIEHAAWELSQREEFDL